MSPEQVLPLLEPLRSPPPVSWWPPAPGWWLLGALLVLGIALLMRALWRRWQRRAPLRQARRELAVLDSAELPPDELAERLAALQRRLAMVLAGRRQCAGLAGTAWIHFLNDLAGEPLLSVEHADLAYRPDVDGEQVQRLLADSQRWLRCLEQRR